MYSTVYHMARDEWYESLREIADKTEKVTGVVNVHTCMV